MIFDAFVTLGESIYGPRPGAAELLASMDELGVDCAVAAPARPPGYHLGPANDALAASVRAAGGRLVGLARVDPLQGTAAHAELERSVRDLGLGGLYLDPWQDGYTATDRAVAPLVEAAAALGVSVVLASGYPWRSETLQAGELARLVPEATLVLTNGGQLPGLGDHDTTWVLRNRPNVHVVTMGNYREDLLEALAALDPRRVLYASAWPAFDPRLELTRIRWSHLAEDAQELVLGLNARRLFG